MTRRCRGDGQRGSEMIGDWLLAYGRRYDASVTDSMRSNEVTTPSTIGKAPFVSTGEYRPEGREHEEGGRMSVG